MYFDVKLTPEPPEGAIVLVQLDLDNKQLAGARLEGLTQHLTQRKFTVIYVVADALREPLVGRQEALAMGTKYLEKNRRYLVNGEVIRWAEWKVQFAEAYNAALQEMVTVCILPSSSPKKQNTHKDDIYSADFLVTGFENSSLSPTGLKLYQACKETAIGKGYNDYDEINSSIKYQTREYVFYKALKKAYEPCYHVYPAPMWSGISAMHEIFPPDALPIYVQCRIKQREKSLRTDGNGLSIGGETHAVPSQLSPAHKVTFATLQLMLAMGVAQITSPEVAPKNRALFAIAFDSLLTQTKMQVFHAKQGTTEETQTPRTMQANPPEPSAIPRTTNPHPAMAPDSALQLFARSRNANPRPTAAKVPQAEPSGVACG